MNQTVDMLLQGHLLFELWIDSHCVFPLKICSGILLLIQHTFLLRTYSSSISVLYGRLCDHYASNPVCHSLRIVSFFLKTMHGHSEEPIWSFSVSCMARGAPHLAVSDEIYFC